MVCHWPAAILAKIRPTRMTPTSESTVAGVASARWRMPIDESRRPPPPDPRATSTLAAPITQKMSAKMMKVTIWARTRTPKTFPNPSAWNQSQSV